MAEKTEKKQLFYKEPMFWGVAATVVILLLALFLGVSETCSRSFIGSESCATKWTLFLASPPNEVGDALAGFAGALAFVWIIVTVAMQSIELREQREELSRTREQFVTMNELATFQRFESSVFEMISTHNQIVQSIDLQSKEYGETSGRDCFKVFYGRLGKKFDTYKCNDDWSDLEKVRWPYSIFWEKNQQNLSHYFRFLFNAFRVIDEFDKSEPRHARLLRALLSDQELLILFYNCLTKTGQPFQKYAMEFDLFDNLPSEQLLDVSHEVFLDAFLSKNTEQLPGAEK